MNAFWTRGNSENFVADGVACPVGGHNEHDPKGKN